VSEEYASLVNTPEAQAYVRDKLASKLKERLQAEVIPHFQGTRRARLDVHVVGFVIPNAAQRVVLGGNPMLGAITTLKDAQTGAELAKSDRLAAAYAGQGVLGVLADQAFSDLEDRVMDTYVAQVQGWLLQK
jgi:hypothetical protein